LELTRATKNHLLTDEAWIIVLEPTGGLAIWRGEVACNPLGDSANLRLTTRN
jgi:hypothetical protein